MARCTYLITVAVASRESLCPLTPERRGLFVRCLAVCPRSLESWIHQSLSARIRLSQVVPRIRSILPTPENSRAQYPRRKPETIVFTLRRVETAALHGIHRSM